MALNIIDNNALAPATSTPTKEKDYSNLPGKESYDTGYMLTEQPKLNPPPATTTPIVQTSGLAQNDVDSTKNFLDWAKTNLGTQAQNAAAALMNENTTKEQKDEALRKAKLEQQKADNETKKTNALTGADTGTDTTTDTTGVKGAGYYTISSSGKKTWHSTDGSGSGEQSGIQDENDQALADFQNMTNKMLNGTFPLNPLQQAQLNAMKTQFTELIDAQKAANKQYEGAIQQAGITGGRSRYAPEIMAGEVLNSVNVGIKKVAELDAKMTSALSEMEAGFQESNYKLVQDSYKAFTEAQKVKQDNLDKIHDDIAEALKQTNEANAKADAEWTKTKTSYLADLAAAGAPADVIALANSATNLQDLYTSGGSYAVKGSGIIGEYNLYRQSEMEQGRTPMSFTSYQDQDANRKIATARASAFADGLTTSQSSFIDKQNTFLSSQPIAKDLNVIQSKFQNLLKALKQGGGAADVGIIYDFMKSLDPTSVVRETEYTTGAYKTGNIFAGMMAKYNGYLNPKGGFVSESAKKEILTAIGNRYETALNDYKNVRNQVVSRAVRQGIANADDYIVDYDNTQNIYNEATFSEKDLGLYLQMNPEKEALAEQIMTDNPDLSDYEVYQLMENM